VEDLFPANAVPKVLENASIKEIILEMTSNRLGATAVINERSSLVGIITDGDLRRMLNKHENFTHIFAKDIMNPSPTVVQTDDYAVHALRIMQEKNITQLVVVKQDYQLLGFVHLHDLLKEGLV
jgi:arabinose-5-phosphate isomerase